MLGDRLKREDCTLRSPDYSSQNNDKTLNNNYRIDLGFKRWDLK